MTTGRSAGDPDKSNEQFYNWNGNVVANSPKLNKLSAITMVDNPDAIRDFAVENLNVDDGVLNAHLADDHQTNWDDMDGDGLLETPHHYGIEVDS